MALNDKMAFTELALPQGVSLYKVGVQPRLQGAAAGGR